MRLSVAIPFYENVEYLAVAMQSLMRQDCDDWDGIVVDDAGADLGVEAVVARVGGGRIRYVRNTENLGLAGNWNRCLELAEHDAVTLFHADDELEPNYVRLVLDAHRRNPDAVGVFTGAVVIGPTGQKTFSFPDEMKRFSRPKASGGEIHVVGEAGLASLLRGQYIFCPTLSYKRSRLPTPTFLPQWRQVTDLDLLARVLVAGGKFAGVTDAAYRYRRHDSNQTAVLTASLDRFREEFQVYDEIAARADARAWPRAARTARRAVKLRLHVCYQAALSLMRRDWKQVRACITLLRERRRLAPGEV